jgi:hypothetical protein
MQKENKARVAELGMGDWTSIKVNLNLILVAVNTSLIFVLSFNKRGMTQAKVFFKIQMQI